MQMKQVVLTEKKEDESDKKLNEDLSEEVIFKLVWVTRTSQALWILRRRTFQAKGKHARTPEAGMNLKNPATQGCVHQEMALDFILSVRGSLCIFLSDKWCDQTYVLGSSDYCRETRGKEGGGSKRLPRKKGREAPAVIHVTDDSITFKQDKMCRSHLFLFFTSFISSSLPSPSLAFVHFPYPCRGLYPAGGAQFKTHFLTLPGLSVRNSSCCGRRRTWPLQDGKAQASENSALSWPQEPGVRKPEGQRKRLPGAGTEKSKSQEPIY